LGAQLIRTAVKKEGGLSATFLTTQDYRWGSIMQVFSTYESRHDTKDPVPFARGINSFQLFVDGTRWWILTIYWAEETPLPLGFLAPSH
jgi:hypothetical protein